MIETLVCRIELVAEGRDKIGLTDAQIESVVQCGVALDVGPAYSVPEIPQKR